MKKEAGIPRAVNEPEQNPRWMRFALGQAVFVILVGLHGVIVKAMPPATVFLRKQGTLATDRRAVRRGWLVVGAGLVWAAIWVGLYRYLVYSGLDPLDTFIAFVVGLSFVAALIGILSSVLGGRLRLL